MTSRHTFARVAVVAAVAAGAAAAALGQTPIVQGNLLGTANDGVICRSNYNGSYSGGAFKCLRQRFHTINLSCPSAQFPNYVIRPAGSSGTPLGRDLCMRNGVNLGSTDALGNLVQGQDYKLAEVDANALATQIANLHNEEKTATGLTGNEIETSSSEPAIQPDQGTGSRDRAVVQVTHYTFAIKTGPSISSAGSALRN
jgi:hypothetical protein